MKFGILILLFFICFSCKNLNEKENEQVQILADSTGLKVKVIKKQTGNSELNSFLEDSIDLQVFKKLKKNVLQQVLLME